MGTVVEGNSFLAVVDVKIFRHHMLAQHESVTKALRRRVADHIVVVLVPGGDESRGMTRVRLQFLP